MIGQEKDAEDERHNRGELPHIRRLVQDEPREKECDERPEAAERLRFGDGKPVYCLHPEDLTESKNKNAVRSEEQEAS